MDLVVTIFIVTILYLIYFFNIKKVKFENCNTDSDCSGSICGRQNVCETIFYD